MFNVLPGAAYGRGCGERGGGWSPCNAIYRLYQSGG